MYTQRDPIGLAGGNPTVYGYVRDSNKQLDIFGLVIGEPLSDSDTVYRIILTGSGGPESFAFNPRELAAIDNGKLDPPGISVLKTDSTEDAMDMWNNAFPDKAVDISSVKGATAADIRNAGYEVHDDPSRNPIIGDAHARLTHPNGKDGFEGNLDKLSSAFQSH